MLDITNKAILEVLKQHNAGLTSSKIAEEINYLFEQLEQGY